MSEELTVQSNQLVPADVIGAADLEVFKDVATSSVFTPYIQLQGTSSELVKEGKFPIGHFDMVKDKQHNDLGDNFIALIVAWRPKAMNWTGEDVVSVFDPKDPLFQEIKVLSDTPNVMGYGYGPEYLFWLPDQQQFATYFLANPTGRREATNFHVLLGAVARVKSRLIKGKKYTWHGPQVAAYSGDIELPDFAANAGIIDAFKNPPKPEVAEEVSDREQ